MTNSEYDLSEFDESVDYNCYNNGNNPCNFLVKNECKCIFIFKTSSSLKYVYT